LAGPTQEDCKKGIHLLLSLLWKTGYKLPERKLRFPRILSNTLGFTCHKNNVTALGEEKAICCIPAPKTS
jgi:hypothetical protein